jgi:hypothetical protein
VVGVHEAMIHTYNVDGLSVQTGDILCTTQGGRGGLTL